MTGSAPPLLKDQWSSLNAALQCTALLLMLVWMLCGAEEAPAGGVVTIGLAEEMAMEASAPPPCLCPCHLPMHMHMRRVCVWGGGGEKETALPIACFGCPHFCPRPYYCLCLLLLVARSAQPATPTPASVCLLVA